MLLINFSYDSLIYEVSLTPRLLNVWIDIEWILEHNEEL